MAQNHPTFLAIDLKSFYASVECIERKLDPITTNLVVADKSRTEKTICLAVSPSLKAYGIPGRARLFEVVQKVREVNARRLLSAPGGAFLGSSCQDPELKSSPGLSLDYIVAPPRMAHYMEYSARIYQIYLKYVAPEDIHVYSIDEVFIDATHYLSAYGLTPREFAAKIMHDVLRTTGITATAGIGTNLYLCKVAMDIVAKHVEPDKKGVRIAKLDEYAYRQILWTHQPLTDFWRIGKGYARKLAQNGLFTMGDIARCSIGAPTDYYNEDLLYKLFGVNAELLIDHAWGWEPCTIADIKAYKPETNSLGMGQVLKCPYSFQKARLVLSEMADSLALDLLEKKLVTDQIVLTVGYDIQNLSGPHIKKTYKGEVTTDRYGRKTPKHAHKTAGLGRQTSSAKLILEAALRLFDEITDESLWIRRLSLTANHVTDESFAKESASYGQLDLFTDFHLAQEGGQEQQAAFDRERKMQQAVLEIRRKYGKNAILKGINFKEGATARERNQQIGGHKA